MKDKSWYKNPYVWLVICFPLSAVIAGLITIRLAVVSDDGLVSDDYYKEGMQINRLLERDKAAAELGLSASINLEQEANKIKVLLIANDNFIFPETIQVSFLNRTRKGHDQKILLHKNTGGLYQGEFSSLIKGKWHVQIETDNWRLLESMVTE